MKDKAVSKPVISRLPRYYRYLGDLLDNDVQRISSSELAKLMNLTASQIRQDLSTFGNFGVQGYGYSIEHLYNTVKELLGLDTMTKIAVIGVGNLGLSLLNYPSFLNRGFEFVMAFDSDKEKIGTEINGIMVKDVAELPLFLSYNDVDIVAITTPKDAAKDLVKKISVSNVRGIWNFTNSDLEAPAKIYVENVFLTDSLMKLSFQINQKEILENFSKKK